MMLTAETFPDFRKLNKEHSLYVTAYRYNDINIREADMIGNLYIDFDVEKIEDIEKDFPHIQEDVFRTLAVLKSIFGINPESVQIYFSGGKGVHLIVPSEVLGIQPHQELNMIFKLIAEDIAKLCKNGTVDTGIYDKVRLFRVPNSIHTKTGHYKVPITLDELRTLDIRGLQSLASAPRKPIPVKKTYITQANRVYQSYVKEWDKEKARVANRRKSAKEFTLDFIPPCIENILTQGAKEGKRNNTSAVLASYYMQRGIVEEDALNQILDWNATHCQPMQPEADITNTVKSIYARNHRYGCHALEELSVCSNTCRLFKGKEERKNT